MSYPGNNALAPDVQKRILGTYQQTLELAARGSQQEALLGCDFILRMDPSFEPARTLMAQLTANPAGVPVFGPDPAAPAAATVLVPVVAPEPPPRAVQPAPTAAPPAGGDALEAALSGLLAKRELKRLVQAAEEHRQEVAANPALRKLVEAAYERLEAEPYVKSFLDSARRAMEVGDFEECDRLLDKARSLDPTHPDTEALATERRQYETPAQPWGSFPGMPAAASVPKAAATPSFEDFSFNETPEPAFSFDPSPLASQAGSGGDGRIRELLAEGQKAFDRGEYQEAIDAWSRIFLIDIDHDEAARRIEEARRLKAENERKVEEIFHEAVAAYEVGDLEKAKLDFERVLAIAPGHLAAREYRDELAGDGPELGFGANEFEPAPLEDAVAAAEPDSGLREEIMVPPAPGQRPAPRAAVTKKTTPAAATSAVAAKGGGSGRRFVLIGGAVLALLGLVGTLAWLKRDLLFPNAKEAEVRPAAADPIAKAKALYGEGKLESAIRRLRLLPKDDPSYIEAQTLAATWENELKAKTEQQAEAQNAPANKARFDRELAQGKDQFGKREYFLADGYFQRAAALGTLDESAAEMAAEAKAKLAPLAEQIKLYRQQEWEAILPTLWTLHEANRNDRDVVRLMVGCYYNLGIIELKGGNVNLAMQRLDEALKLRPESDLLKRHRLFAASYVGRPKDLLYRIYVRLLPVQ